MIAYYLSILRQRAGMIVLITTLCAPAAFLAFTYGQETYSSEAVIEVGASDVADGLLDSGRAFVEPERRVATELEVLSGRAVAAAAAERLRGLGRDEAVEDLMRRVDASARGTASAVEVIGSDSTPERAQQLTSAFVTSYIEYRQELQRAELTRLQADLQARLASAAGARDSQARYDQLAEWLEGVNVRLSIDTTGLRLVSPPAVPEDPVNGTPPAVAALASLVGALLVGCVVALIVDLVRDAVRNRAEVEALLPGPTLVEVPRTWVDRYGFLRARSGDPGLSVPAARGLRLQLADMIGSNAPGRILFAGSAKDHDDVFGLATTLAATYGRSDLRVLVVADPARGMEFEDLTQPVDVPTLEPGRAPAVFGTSLPGLHWVPATTAPDGAGGVLDGYDPSESLKALSRWFDVVIVVVPPTADDSEAVALSHLVDAIVVVCVLGLTPAKRLQRLVSALERSGSIVNAVALTSRTSRRRSRVTEHAERPRRLTPVG